MRAFATGGRRFTNSLRRRRASATAWRSIGLERLEPRRLLAFTIGSLTDSPDPVYRGQAFTLTANNVVITTGHPIAVDFYRETNGRSGLQAAEDLLVDVDDNSSGGYAVSVLTGGLSPGTYTYYARGEDLSDTGGVSNIVSATNTVVPAPPSIASLTDAPDPVVSGDNVTLTANGVADSDSPIAAVNFYRESNGTPGLQTSGDAFLGADDNGADGYRHVASTIFMTPGDYTYYAQAVDSTGLSSNVVSTTNTVSYPLDRFESNDSFDTSTNFGVVEDRTELGLSLHTPDDADYFRMFSARATVLDVTLSFGPGGRMTLVMFDAGRHEIARSVGGASGYAAVRIEVGNDDRYYFETLSADNAANPSYALRIISTPSIASVSVDPNPSNRGAPITVTANGVVDDRAVTVAFYRESNGDPGLQQNDQLLGEDTDPTDGYSVAATAGDLAGNYTYYAVGRDPFFLGNPVSVQHLVKNRPPAITGLSVSTYPSSPGRKLTLTALVSDPDGNLPTVTFLVESNGHGGLQPVDGDHIVAVDEDPDGGYTAVLNAAGMPVGAYTYYAYAEDPATGASAVGQNALTAVAVVPRPGDANFDGAINFEDLVVLAQNYNTQGKNFRQGDFNYDANVDFNDLVILAQGYNTATASAAAASPVQPAATADLLARVDAPGKGVLDTPVFSLRRVITPVAKATPAVRRVRR
jgi:hypothetical protein